MVIFPSTLTRGQNHHQHHQNRTNKSYKNHQQKNLKFPKTIKNHHENHQKIILSASKKITKAPPSRSPSTTARRRRRWRPAAVLRPRRSPRRRHGASRWPWRGGPTCSRPQGPRGSIQGPGGEGMWYPLVNCDITMENHHVLWKTPLFLWSIFHSYVTIYWGWVGFFMKNLGKCLGESWEKHRNYRTMEVYLIWENRKIIGKSFPNGGLPSGNWRVCYGKWS